MTYVVKEVNSCTKKLVFNFETLDLTTEIKGALLEKQKKVNLKGFRKGKAPLNMVEKMYGQQIETDALNSFIQNRLFEAVTKEDLKVVGFPTLENMKYDQGKSVSFDAVVEVFPTVEVKDFSKLSFTTEKVSVEDSDVDDVIKTYLNSRAEMKELEDESAKLEKGHFAVMNFQGEKPDGSKPENMKGEEFLLEIGSGQFIPGFEDGMIGMKKGEKKVLELTFPEDYQAEELKGAKVNFEVELLEIKTKNYPELTDELAKEFGFESVEDFKSKNKNNLLKQRDRSAKEKLHQAILEKLVDENDFDVPNALVVQQENHLKEEVKGTLQSQGFNDEMMNEYFIKWQDDLQKKALFQVRSGLILEALAKKFNVEVGDSEFDAKVAEIADGSGIEVEQLKKYYTSNDKMKKNIMYAIREEKTFDAIRKEVKITEA